MRREAEHRRADIERIASEQQSVQDAQARTVVMHDVAATLHGDGYDPPQNLIFNLQVGNYGTLPITSVIGKLTLRARPGEEAADNTPFAFVIPAGKSDVLTRYLPLSALPDDLAAAAESLTYNALKTFIVGVNFTDVHGTQWAFQYGPGEQPRRQSAR